MNTYTDHDGKSYTLYGPVIEDLYADLVAAIHIGRALEAKCERLEEQVRALTAANHSLFAELAELKAWRQDATQAGWRS